MLRWKDELTVKHIGLLGCASVLTLACFSIETRVYLLTTSAPTVCFPFSILNTDKGKLINVDWIQPGELLTHSLWRCVCTCEQVYVVLSGFVLLQGICECDWEGNESVWSLLHFNTRHQGYNLSKRTMWLHLQSQNIPRIDKAGNNAVFHPEFDVLDVLLEISDLKVGMATLIKITFPYILQPLEYLHFL